MGQSFSAQTLKVNSKMASSRLTMMQNKSNNQAAATGREVAELLDAGKLSLAEIKVESILKEKDMIIACELLQLHCDRIWSRIALVNSQPKCPDDVFQAVSTVIYCSTRMANIPEFAGMTKQFALKYSKEWVDPLNTKKQYVDPKVLERIEVVIPSRQRVVDELVAIAKQYSVEFTPPAIDKKMIKEQKEAEEDEEIAQLTPSQLEAKLTREIEDASARESKALPSPSPVVNEKSSISAVEKTVESTNAARPLTHLDFPDVPSSTDGNDKSVKPSNSAVSNDSAAASPFAAYAIGSAENSPSPVRNDDHPSDSDDLDDLTARLNALKQK